MSSKSFVLGEFTFELIQDDAHFEAPVFHQLAILLFRLFIGDLILQDLCLDLRRQRLELAI